MQPIARRYLTISKPRAPGQPLSHGSLFARPVLFSILLRLGVYQLLRGVTRKIQHPKEYRVLLGPHGLGTISVSYLTHFWGWEFRLRQVTQRTFPLYLFVALYVILQYLLCTLLYRRRAAV
jgi:hypothetical protein